MSAEITYLFDNPANFIFDSDKIDISGGEGKLKLVDNPGQDFVEDFVDDTDFVYDNTKAIFVGGALRQKDQRPIGATFGATFTNDIDGSWGDGVLTGIPVGGASVAGGKLVCDQSDIRYAEYNAALNGNSGSVGCIRFLYTPRYNGAPGINIGLIGESNGVSIPNCLFLQHTSSGQFWFTLYCGVVATVSINAAWFPVLDTEVEIEINWDTISGSSRVFIDGVQHGTTSTGTGTRSAVSDSIKIGSIYNPAGFVSNALFDDVLFFDSVQHTANYTPGYIVPENDYVETTVVCPEMEYIGPGALVSFDNFLTTQIGIPKYTLQIGRSGNYLYWDGATWSVSDGSYAQSTSKADFIANLSSLPVLCEIYGQFKIHFTDSSTISSIAELTASLTAQIYPVDSPTIQIAQGFRTEELLDFVETVTKTGSDEIKYILEKDSDWYYWSGAAWVVSDETYTQSNTVAEIIANIATFTTSSICFSVKMFLHSSDGCSTPSIQELKITFDFSGLPEDDFFRCNVYWYERNPDGSVCSELIYAEPSSFNVRYKNNIAVCQKKIYATIDPITAEVELNLIENVNMVDKDGNPVIYNVLKNNRLIGKISVPELSGALFWDILI